jgi:transposase-like protein
MRFLHERWPKLRSSTPLERVNLEIARRSDVVGNSPRLRWRAMSSALDTGLSP